MPAAAMRPLNASLDIPFRGQTLARPRSTAALSQIAADTLNACCIIQGSSPSEGGVARAIYQSRRGLA